MIGLNTDPAANASYTSLDYAFYFWVMEVIEFMKAMLIKGSIVTVFLEIFYYYL